MDETEEIQDDSSNELRDAEWAAKREQARLKHRPDISHLPDAIVDNEFLVRTGQKLVIERVCSALASKTWLDTKTYEVKSYDGVTGDVDLYDDETNRRVLMNVRRCAELGYSLKQAHVKVGKVHRIRRTKGERAEKKKLDAEANKERAANKRELKKKVPGLRRLYASDGSLTVLFKGKTYVAPRDTRVTANDFVHVLLRLQGSIEVRRPSSDLVETWAAKLDG